MKALLVTSRVTFAPNNYNDLVNGLADAPQIGGLLILDNSDIALLKTGFGLCALGARRTGLRLIFNQLGVYHRQRSRAYALAGKPVWQLPTVNCPEAEALIRDQGFDLIVNARTRYIYKKPILDTPRLGCVNIHHGLLPNQRGTMCDLWSIAENVPTGFSIHRMSPKIDAGNIIRTVQVSDGSDMSYEAYLLRGMRRELEEVKAFLAELEADETVITGVPNVGVPGLKHRKNPTIPELREMLKKGMIL